ncbi:MAG: K(+)-transporting ATPase subunit F [Gemmatimonadales bacterium]|jgi:K+-transporting ATPase KdpF subunit
MSAIQWLGLVITIVLSIYLFVALTRPEEF